jgi:3-hydroxybutyryl-CoA dehydrogenase
MDIQTVGVIGAGVIGSSVAQDLAQTGHRVILLDALDEALARARENIGRNARLYRFYQKDKPIQEPGAVLERITFSTDYEQLARASFVIENVTENWDIKRQVYAQIDAICPPVAIFAANTSCIPITRLASVTRRSAQVIGLHFMNPVPLMPAVEVIRGYHTSDETMSAALDLLARMGKEGIVVNDAPGFVSNRVMTLAINEAAFLVYEQVALASDIDRIFKTCYGHKMGPLETADLIGVDTILYSMEALYENFNDSKFRPCPLLKQMVYAGLLGRKSGRGFYNYEDQ